MSYKGRSDRETTRQDACCQPNQARLEKSEERKTDDEPQPTDQGKLSQLRTDWF